MSSSDDSERRVAEALRARATGAGRAGVPRAVRQAPVAGPDVRIALLIALVGGVVLGVALALLSLLAPGVLPGPG